MYSLLSVCQFSVLLSIVFVLEIAAAITALVLDSEVYNTAIQHSPTVIALIDRYISIDLRPPDDHQNVRLQLDIAGHCVAYLLQTS